MNKPVSQKHELIAGQYSLKWSICYDDVTTYIKDADPLLVLEEILDRILQIVKNSSKLILICQCFLPSKFSQSLSSVMGLSYLSCTPNTHGLYLLYMYIDGYYIATYIHTY